MGCGRSKTMSKHDTNDLDQETYSKSTDQKINKDSGKHFFSHLPSPTQCSPHEIKKGGPPLFPTKMAAATPRKLVFLKETAPKSFYLPLNAPN
jgi:hypothetical protein